MENRIEDIMTNEELGASIRLKRLKRKLIVAAVIVVAILLTVGIIWFQGNRIKELNEKIDEQSNRIEELLNEPGVANPVTPKISLDVVNTELKEIGELATMEYMYTNAARFSDSKQIKEWNIPFTEKSFIIKWDGVIKAGVDVNQITTTLDETEMLLTVRLPQAEILSHDTDEDSVEVLDESNGLFNPVSVEDKVQFDTETEREMEERAIENGLLEKAQENAEEVISKLLNANPDIAEHYRIEFEIVK